MGNRLTLNGLNTKINGVKEITELCLKNIEKDIGEIKQNLGNDIKHIQEDLETLKRGYWKTMGGIVALLALFEFASRVIIPIFLK